MLDIAMAAIAGLSLALGLASVPLRRLPVTEPLAAMLLGVVLGPALLGVLDLGPRPEPALQVSARIVLAMSLMATALRFTLDEIRQHLARIVLLLTVVLAGMMLLTGALATAALGVPLATAALLGAALAPTDPVLASSIVAGRLADEQLPTRTRLLLSIESAANDGLSFALVALAAAGIVGASMTGALVSAALQFALSVGLGAGLGWAVGWLVVFSERHRDMEHTAFLAITLALALLVLGAVDALGGEGILAVFIAGLAYGHVLSRTDREEEWQVQEAINRYLILPVFTLFGAALPWDGWGMLGGAGVGFAAAVLLLRRMPLLLALRRALGVDWAEATFMGWFGPIGVAALYYLAHWRLRGAADEQAWAAGTLVIALSTVVHGVTAAPGREQFHRWRERGGAGARRGR